MRRLHRVGLRSLFVVLMAVGFLLASGTFSTAATRYWRNNAGNGNWNDATKWSSVSAADTNPANNGVPLAGEPVIIVHTDGAQRFVALNVSAPSQGMLSIDLTGAGIANNTLTITSNNNLQTTGIFLGGYNGSVATNGRGAITQSAGAVGSTTDLVIGNGTGSSGVYTITGTGSLNVSNNLLVGNFGTGTMNIQGQSSVFVSNGLSINPLSTVNLNGGTLHASTIAGANRLNFNSGKLQLDGDRNFSTDSTLVPLFGNPATIPSAKTLEIFGIALVEGSIDTPHKINGGRLEASTVNVGTDFSGALEIINGGTVNTATFRVAAPAPLDPDYVEGFARVSGAGSSLTSNLMIIGHLYPDGNQFEKTRFGTLILEEGALIDTGVILLQKQGIINIYGGTLRFDDFYVDFQYPDNKGQFNFYAGTLLFTGDRTIGTDHAIDYVFGGAPILLPGKELAVEGTATLATSVTLDGGTFTAPTIANGNRLILKHGTLNITNQAVTIQLGGLLGNTLDLNDDMTVNVNSGITNQGLITGDGQIGGTFTNAAAGELRGEPGKSLKLTGGTFAATNSGRITLYGGMIEFTQNLFNNAGAFISGNGTLKTNTLNNSGTMNFAGTANILGTVTNNAGGKVISGGGGATIFYGDVTNNGEIRTSTNGFTVFFGSVSGSGTFTGTGTVNAEGDLSPGSSPAAVSFGGDVVLGAAASLQIEIGGLTAGTQHDKLTVAGDLSLDGTLNVSLFNNFVPSAGQSFNILDWGSLAGTFDAINLPTLAGLAWNTSQLYTTGVLSVAAAGIPGDFNNDGKVDAGDYVTWRKNNGTNNALANDNGLGTPIGTGHYNLWRANFGNPPGSGSGVTANAAVPEPSTLVMVVLAAAGVCSRRRRAA